MDRLSCHNSLPTIETVSEAMDSRRDRLSLVKYMFMLVIVYAYITGVNTTACTDGTALDEFYHIKGMCESGILKNTRLVIDTWGTGGSGTYSCTCTVTLDTESASPTASTTVVVEEYPRVAPLQNCGSKLRISSTKSSSFTETGCTPIPATPTYNFGRTDMLTLMLSRTDVSSSWISGHCIYIYSEGSANLELIVTCAEPQGKTNQSKMTTITTTHTTTEYIPTTTVQQLTTTTEYIPTTTIQPLTTTTTTYTKETTANSRETTANSRETTTINNINYRSTASGQEKCVQESHPQLGYPLSAVVAPLVVTTLLITVSVMAHVILYRRRLTLVKQPVYTEAVMTSPNPVHYDSLDLSRVEPPNLYADTSTGQMYVNTAMES